MTARPEAVEDPPIPADSSVGPAAGAPASSATLGGEQRRSVEQITLLLFITVPFVALVAAVPLAWGWG